MFGKHVCSFLSAFRSRSRYNCYTVVSILQWSTNHQSQGYSMLNHPFSQSMTVRCFSHCRKTCSQTFSSSRTKYRSRSRSKPILNRLSLRSITPEACETEAAPALFHVNSRDASTTEAIRINGNMIAQEIKEEIKAEIDSLTQAGKRRPHLAVLLIGSDPASVIYVRNKAKAADFTGILCDIVRLPDTATEKDVLREIHFLNSLPDNDGILVQLPLPPHINERVICDAVLPRKDVDGFNVLNVGRFCVDQKAFIPATPSGVLEIIKRLNIETCGKNAVVCGRSKNVGMPIAMHLHSDSDGRGSAGNATTTICHRYTPPEQLKFFTKTADILITATGVPNLVTADMVKEGVVVIDIGISRILDNKGKARLVGDVAFEGVSQKASYITPVPGGVGPVTVAMVLKNTLIAYNQEIDFGIENPMRL